MTYLCAKDYRHDAFVSYGHGPSESSDNTLSKWTHELAEDLQEDIGLALGTKDKSRLCHIWFDPALRGNDPLTDTLRDAIGGSAVFLVVMSPFFLQSQWCKDEVAWFAETCRRRGETAARRIFVVRAMETDRAKWPEEIRDSRGFPLDGYAFHSSTDIHYPFGYRGAKGHKGEDYGEAVRRLASDMSKVLRELEGASSGKADVESAAPPAEARTAPTATAGTVFLGCMHDSLDEERDNLRAILTQKGVVVLPPEEQVLVETSLNDSLNRHLRKADAMVLVANEAYCKWPVNQPGGFIAVQIQKAREMNKPCHLWLKTPDLGKIKRPDYRQYLETLSQEAASAALAIRHDDLGSFAEYVLNGLAAARGPDNVQNLDIGEAVICTNHADDEELGREIHRTIKDVLHEWKQTSTTFHFTDPNETQIKLSKIGDAIRDADTILVLCFDQDWNWAKPFIKKLYGSSKVLSHDKVRVFVAAPHYRDAGDFDAGGWSFPTANCTQIGVAEVRQRLRDAMQEAKKRAAGKDA